VTRSFTLACADLQPTERYIVYAGEEAYPLGKDVMAMSVQGMMERVWGV
jgi:hypothetical protein